MKNLKKPVFFTILFVIVFLDIGLVYFRVHWHSFGLLFVFEVIALAAFADWLGVDEFSKYINRKK